MHPVIDALLQLAERHPLPDGQASSYWQRYGKDIVVQRTTNGLAVQAPCLETVKPVGVVSRLLCGIERWSYRSVTAQLDSYPAIWRLAQQLTYQLSGGPHFTFQVFKSACALSVLVDHGKQWGLAPKTCVVIGDGCGFFGALLRRYWVGARVYCVDLPKALVLQAWVHSCADRAATMAWLRPEIGRPPAAINFVLPQNLEEIQEHEIDWAINIASMQEMTPESIARYFTFLRKRSHPASRFYCVNRLEKQLPGGEVIAFHHYPWQEDDEVFIDGSCPYYTHFFSPHTASHGPRMLGMRVPWLNYFEGRHLHRLVRLAPLDGEQGCHQLRNLAKTFDS